MEIKIVDKNKEVISAVSKMLKKIPYPNISAKVGDIFKEEGIIVSASNPNFTFGGGLDAEIYNRFPKECGKTRKHKGKNQRIGNIVFTITVDDKLHASRQSILSAIQFALSETKSSETLLLSGLGTGVGGLDVDEFVSVLIEALNDHFGYRWKFLRLGMRSESGSCKWEKMKWKQTRRELEMCGWGFHCSRRVNEAFGYVQGELLALVEVSGKVLKEDDKECHSRMRVLKTYKWDKRKSVELVVFAAEQVLDLFEKEHPNDKRPRNAILAAKKYLKIGSGAAARAARAAGAAAWAAGDAAGAAAGDAAWAAAGAAARAATGDAAWAAARAAAWAAWAAARAAARAAAGAARAAAGDAGAAGAAWAARAAAGDAARAAAGDAGAAGAALVAKIALKMERLVLL